MYWIEWTFILVSSSAITALVPNWCVPYPSGAAFYEPLHRCYWTLPAAHGIDSAQRACSNGNGTVGMMYDDGSNDFIKDKLFNGTCKSTYIGIYDRYRGQDGETCDAIWQTDSGYDIKWMNWQFMNIQDGIECVIMSNFYCMWQNKNCSESFPVLCEATARFQYGSGAVFDNDTQKYYWLNNVDNSITLTKGYAEAQCKLENGVLAEMKDNTTLRFIQTMWPNISALILVSNSVLLDYDSTTMGQTGTTASLHVTVNITSDVTQTTANATDSVESTTSITTENMTTGVTSSNATQGNVTNIGQTTDNSSYTTRYFTSSTASATTTSSNVTENITTMIPNTGGTLGNDNSTDTTTGGTLGDDNSTDTPTGGTLGNDNSTDTTTGGTLGNDNYTDTTTGGTLGNDNYTDTTTGGTLGNDNSTDTTTGGTLGNDNYTDTTTGGMLGNDNYTDTTTGGTLGNDNYTDTTTGGTLGNDNYTDTTTGGTLGNDNYTDTTTGGTLGNDNYTDTTTGGTLGNDNYTDTTTGGTLGNDNYTDTTTGGTLGNDNYTDTTTGGTLGNDNYTDTTTGGTLGNDNYTDTTTGGTLGNDNYTDTTTGGTLGNDNYTDTTTGGTLRNDTNITTNDDNVTYTTPVITPQPACIVLNTVNWELEARDCVGNFASLCVSTDFSLSKDPLEDSNDCVPDPCNGRGQCIDQLNDYTCICGGGRYTGKNCETVLCLNPTAQYNSVTNKCLWSTDELVSYSEGAAHCQIHGGRHIVPTFEDREFIWRYSVRRAPWYIYHWLGATDTYEEGVWVLTDGNVRTNPQWRHYNSDKSPEPNGKEKQNCVYSRDDTMKWYDGDCSDTRKSLCEAYPEYIPPGSVMYLNETYFWYVPKNLSAEEANQQCQRYDGQLATISDNSTLDFIRQIISTPYNSVWTGLRSPSPNVWASWDQSSNVSWINWAPGYDGSSNGCVVLNEKFSMEEAPCSEQFTFLCEHIGINECSSDPCLNGGSCIDLFQDYACYCYGIWTGKNCEIPLCANLNATYYEEGHMCFWPSVEATNQTEGMESCHQFGGKLTVDALDSYSVKFLKGKVFEVDNKTIPEYMWVGVSDLLEHGSWKTMDIETPAATFWQKFNYDKEPHEIDEKRCAVICSTSFGWEDAPCHLNYRSFCQANASTGQMNAVSQRYFWYNDTELTAEKANAVCRESEGQLATIMDNETFTSYIQYIFPSNETYDFWTGIKREMGGNIFLSWDNKPITWLEWDPTFLVDPDLNCTILTETALLKTVDCHETHGFVCEFVGVTDCSSQPCINGGTCIELMNEYACSCQNHTHGKNCEKIYKVYRPEETYFSNITQKYYWVSTSEMNITAGNQECGRYEGQLVDVINAGVREFFNSGQSIPNELWNGITSVVVESNIKWTTWMGNFDLGEGLTHTYPSSVGRCGVLRRGINAISDNECTGTHTILCESHGIDGCHSNPCMNGGMCIDKFNGTTCLCESKYNGTYCEEELCSMPGAIYYPENQLCYWIQHDALSFEDAMTGCKENNASLAVITDKYLENYILSKSIFPTPVCSGEKFWINGRDTSFDGIWMTWKGYVLSHTSWKAGKTYTDVKYYQPDKGGVEGCAAVSPLMQWYDEECEKEYQSVCQLGYSYECVVNPCINGGTCVNKTDDYLCNCAPGFYGRNCEFETTCLHPQAQFNNLTQKCYWIGYEPADFEEASDLCGEYGGQLATVYSDVVDYLRNNVFNKTDIGEFWINVHDVYLESIWMTWERQLLTSTNWDTNFPNETTKEHDCVVADKNRMFTWQNTNCSVHYPYLCEAKYISGDEFPCKQPGAHFYVPLRRCYWFIKNDLTTFNGESRCNALGGRLANIYSEDNKYFIHKKIFGTSSASCAKTWIGIRDQIIDGDPEKPVVSSYNESLHWTDFESKYPSYEFYTIGGHCQWYDTKYIFQYSILCESDVSREWKYSPPNSVFYPKTNDYFWYPDKRLSIIDAIRECQEYDGILADVTSELKNFLQTTIFKSMTWPTSYWNGYKSNSTGHHIRLDFFHDVLSIDVTTRCVYVDAPDTVLHKNCNEQEPFICQSYNVDNCASDPCRKGLCINDVKGYTCECFLGYNGTHCENYIGNSSCLNKDAVFNSESNTCYWMVLEYATAEEAEQECQEHEGYLATVYDESTNIFIQNEVLKGGLLNYFWIGVNDSSVEGHFMSWNKNGLHWTNWASTPSDTSDCVIANSNYTWQVEDCSKKYVFLCESKSYENRPCINPSAKLYYPMRRCYWLINNVTSITIEEGAKDCMKDGGHPATIYNGDVNKIVIYDLLNGTCQDAWLGLHYNASQSNWMSWKNGGLNWFNWYSSPSPIDTEYVYLEHDTCKWKTTQNDSVELNYIICESEAYPELFLPTNAHFFSKKGSYYWYVPEQRNASDAQAECQKHEGTLALMDEETHIFTINSVFNGDDSKDYWIGIYYDSTDSTWKAQNGEEQKWFNWTGVAGVAGACAFVPANTSWTWDEDRCNSLHGFLCQWTDINNCDSNPCQHGGICIDDLNSYTCTCQAGLSGDHCQIYTPEAECFHPEAVYNNVTKSCYWFIYKDTDVYNASKECQTYNGVLANIYDENTTEFLTEKIFNGVVVNGFWIGVKGSGDGSWSTWMNNLLSWTSWSSPPDSGMFYVTAGSSYIWTAVNKTEQKPFLCESSPQNRPCVHPKARFHSTLKRCFWMEEDLMNSFQAQDKCQEFGGNLANVYDQEIENFIIDGSDILTSTCGGNMWIGLKELAMDGVYDNNWSTFGGYSLQWTHWSTGQPNNYHAVQECIVFYKPIEWHDRKCTDLHQCSACESRAAYNSGLLPVNAMFFPPTLSYYWLVDNSTTAFEANRECQRHNGLLAVIYDNSTLDFIKSNIFNGSMPNATWIAPNNLKDNNVWQTWHHVNLTWQDWEMNYPNTSVNNHCTILNHNLKWENKNCNDSYSFICEYSRPCVPDPCVKGTCKETPDSDMYCECHSGYNGTYCEIDINECRSEPCMYNGTCIDRVDNYECNCIAGTVGRNCEINIDDCSNVTCQNGGSCVDSLNNYTCNCSSGFEGSHCESNIDDCTNVTCQNGGSCVDSLNNYTCNCTSGFEGLHCEINIDDCSNVTCYNGGSCVDSLNNYTCKCLPVFEGLHCETRIARTRNLYNSSISVLKYCRKRRPGISPIDIEQMTKEMKLARYTLSRSYRRRICASDNRVSAIALGSVSITVIVCVAACLFCLDLSSICIDKTKVTPQKPRKTRGRSK